jgi:curved DNA-binding protein
MEHRVNISLEEAFEGTTRTLTTGSETFTAKIPKGAQTGTKIRLRGKGSAGAGGSGDLYLVVRVEPHPTFKRDGHNLHVTVPVDVTTAVLGGKATVPTLSGTVRLSIPAGTQGGRTFRLRGKGMPDLRNSEQFGDLLATINIQVPENLTEQERQLYEQLAELGQTK